MILTGTGGVIWEMGVIVYRGQRIITIPIADYVSLEYANEIQILRVFLGSVRNIIFSLLSLEI
jgi:hypothetical protein